VNSEIDNQATGAQLRADAVAAPRQPARPARVPDITVI
jgi:hypothetical protein